MLKENFEPLAEEICTDSFVKRAEKLLAKYKQLILFFFLLVDTNKVVKFVQ